MEFLGTCTCYRIKVQGIDIIDFHKINFLKSKILLFRHTYLSVDIKPTKHSLIVTPSFFKINSELFLDYSAAVAIKIKLKYYC